MIAKKRWGGVGLGFMACLLLAPVFSGFAGRKGGYSIKKWVLPKEVRLDYHPEDGASSIGVRFLYLKKKFGGEVAKEMFYCLASKTPMVDFDGVRLCYIGWMPPGQVISRKGGALKSQTNQYMLFVADYKKNSDKETIMQLTGKDGWRFKAVKLVKDALLVWLDVGKESFLLELPWKPGNPPTSNL